MIALKHYKNIIIGTAIFLMLLVSIIIYQHSKETSFLKKEFSVVSIPYGFIFDMEQNISPETEIIEGVISIYDEKSRTFASLGHPIITKNDEMPQEGVVMSFVGENAPQMVGTVTENTFVGCFGKFIPEHTPPIYTRMKIMHPNDIKEGNATLLMLDKTKTLKEYEGKLSFRKEGFPLSFSIENENFEGANEGTSGSIILQDGKITAIVCARDKQKGANKLYAITAYEMVRTMLKHSKN